MVKFQALQEAFPNAPRGFNVVYLGSSSLPRDSAVIIRLARLRRARLLWNQNGVAYPAWAGPGWHERNREIRRGLRSEERRVGKEGGVWGGPPDAEENEVR